MSQKDIAAITGLARDTVTKARRELESAGAIRRTDRSWECIQGYSPPRRITRCESCRRPAEDATGRRTGKLCPTCKAHWRRDRAWRHLAVRRAKQMLDEDGRVDMEKLLRIVRKKFPQVRMQEHTRDTMQNSEPGLFEVLKDNGMLDVVTIRLFRERQGSIDLG